MSDLISRQAAIDACKHAWAKGLEPSQYIEILPSAEPERKKGKWIEPDEEEPFLFCGHSYIPPLKCSECGRTALNEPWTFCPNCGAYMR